MVATPWPRTAIDWAGNVVGNEDQMEERKCLEKEMAKCKRKQIPRETRSAEESKYDEAAEAGG